VLKLLKLAGYGLIGYAIYEFVSGILESPSPVRNRVGAPSTKRQPQRSSRRGPIMTGQGEGELVPVSDSSGVERRERVGRGIVGARRTHRS
jgi:hypothetical protein